MSSRSSFGTKPKPAKARRTVSEPVLVQGSVHLPGVQKIIQRQDYTPEEALAEFIDNSYSARLNANVRIQIDITQSVTGGYTLRIDDDASGIPSDALAQVLSYGLSMGKGNNNEHGAGMKQAASSGNTYLRKIESNAAASDAFFVEFENANALYAPVQVNKSARKQRGTMFELELPPNHALLNAESYSHIIQRLQVMYQKTLGQSLFITMRNTTLGNGNAKTLVPDNASKYVYNPAFDSNTWLVKGHVLQGNGWSAKINVGYLPERSSPFLLRKGSSSDANEQSQYNSEQKGLYIFKKERLIGQLASWRMHASLPKAFAGNSDNQKNLVLEIEVDDGIATVPTKNALANPPQDDNTLDTPLTELQNSLYKYLNRLTLDLQPDQTLIASHLLGARGIHTLMQTIDLAESPKEKVGPESLDLSNLEPSWRAGWKTIAPFGDWRIWSHPLHEVCLVMHRKGPASELDYTDIPNYSLLQMHIEKVLSRAQQGIILFHERNESLNQQHVPPNSSVYVRELNDTKTILSQLASSIQTGKRKNKINLPTTTGFEVICLDNTRRFKSMLDAIAWVNSVTGLDRVNATALATAIKNKTKCYGLSWEKFDAGKVYTPTDIRALPSDYTGVPIICLETGKIFPSVKHALSWINTTASTNILAEEGLRLALRSGSKIYHGLHWEKYVPSKTYYPTNINATPRVLNAQKYAATPNLSPTIKSNTSEVVCIETGTVFKTPMAAINWINENSSFDIKSNTGLYKSLKSRNNIYYGLTWEKAEPQKTYTATNPDAKPQERIKLPPAAKKEIFCSTTQETFKNLHLFSVWIKANAGYDVSLSDLVKTLKSPQKEIHGYAINYTA